MTGERLWAKSFHRIEGEESGSHVSRSGDEASARRVRLSFKDRKLLGLTMSLVTIVRSIHRHDVRCMSYGEQKARTLAASDWASAKPGHELRV